MPFPLIPALGQVPPAPALVSPAVAQVTPLSVQDEIGETMMMGLRLTREGVSRAGFQARFGRELVEIFGTQIERLIRLGLLEWAGAEGDTLRLTRRGRFLGNQVFVEFI
jgi:oxygen-independent coproporphyrinogen-3 oxidase